MTLSNLERMIKLAEDSFSAKSDPRQLNVDKEVIAHLKRIHPATVSEFCDENGPVAWMIFIPTTLDLMHQFLEDQISEKELYDLTPLDGSYEALYLSSALVLEEYRRKGITKQLAIKSIEQIRLTHPLKALFVWVFSSEGDKSAESIARIASLPLYKKPK